MKFGAYLFPLLKIQTVREEAFWGQAKYIIPPAIRFFEVAHSIEENSSA
jgi:hypothetical protein